MGTHPPPQKGAEPQFSAHVYCGQTAAWIKMPLGTEVGLGQEHILLDGDPAPPPQKRRQDATWYGGRPLVREICVRWGPIPLRSLLLKSLYFITLTMTVTLAF